MYTNIVFILYIIAILVSLVCMVFIGLIFVRKNDRGNQVYISVRRFSIVVMATALLYFIFYYREIVQQQYELALPFRLTDYILCTAVFFCWFLVIAKLSEKKSLRKTIFAGLAITILRLVSSLIVTTLFMGSYYNIDDPDVLQIWTVIEMGFILLTSVILICCCLWILPEDLTQSRKLYTMTCSALLMFWSFSQGIVDIGLFSGKYGISAWALEIPDFTGALLFFINLATCIFVFQEDFSPLFFDDKMTQATESTAPSSSSDKLDAIAAAHRLTVREREVLGLLYEGYTNPDISRTLYISINTVKKHTHNIFEKMDASGRMEVVHLINAWTPKK